MLLVSRPLPPLRPLLVLGLIGAFGAVLGAGARDSAEARDTDARGPRPTDAAVDKVDSGRPTPGEWLMAAPTMPDPTFEHAEILIVHHDKAGALGFDLNRPERLRQQGVEVASCGPVGKDHAVALHSPATRLRSTRPVSARWAISDVSDVLEAVREGAAIDRLVVCVGYAGWGPGQLEAELAEGVWAVKRSRSVP